MGTLFSILKESGTKVETTAAIGDDLRIVTDRLNNIMAGFSFSGIVIQAAQHEKRKAPRAENSLRVKISQNGNTCEAVSSDFSMTGMRLKTTQAANEREAVELGLYMPNDDLDQYENQDPISLAGHITWQRKDGDSYLCGVEFVNLSSDKRDILKKCFAFFRKNAEF
jgi:methyl-accepting chemotaxis protein